MTTFSKYRLLHYAQVPCKPFVVESDDLEYLLKIKKKVLLRQNGLYNNRVIPDYTNSLMIEELIPEESRGEDDDPEDPYWHLDDDEIQEILEEKGNQS